MKSFIPCLTALWPIRLGKQVSLALLSKRPRPSLCRDVNSHYPVTAAWRETWGMAERKGKKHIHVCFFFFGWQREGNSVPEAVLRKMSYKEKRCLVPKQKTEAGEDRPQCAEHSRPAQIYYQLQLQHGLECEESYWAGVLVQGSKPHSAAHTHFPFTYSIAFG